MSPASELAACTAPLLDPTTSPGEVHGHLDRLDELLSLHTPFRRSEEISSGETWLESGLAISPTQAAMCLRDVRRTHAFASGLHAAIESAAAAHPGRAVHVLYAGCGPYALLALPSLAAPDGERARFTLVDVHQECVASARTLIASLGLAHRIKAFVCADATTYRLSADDPPDVVLLETMNACLYKEPQVALARNLLGQAPDALMVPRSVRVDVVLVNRAREHAVPVEGGPIDVVPDRDRIPLGTAFELSPESVERWAGIGGGTLPGGRILFPTRIEPRYTPMLFTVIETADGIRISNYDSGLTLPHVLEGDPGPLAGATVEFRYELGSPPRLVIGGAAS